MDLIDNKEIGNIISIKAIIKRAHEICIDYIKIMRNKAYENAKNNNYKEGENGEFQIVKKNIELNKLKKL